MIDTILNHAITIEDFLIYWVVTVVLRVVYYLGMGE